MKQTNNQAANVPATIKTSQAISLYTDKNGKPLTAKQTKRKIASLNRKATNEAGKNLVTVIKEELSSLDIIRKIFASQEFIKDIDGKVIAAGVSTLFCEALSKETGKALSVTDVLKLPIREYMDFVKEIEASRQLVRGITPKEFKDIITRYYRGEKARYNFLNKEAKEEVMRRITLNTNI